MEIGVYVINGIFTVVLGFLTHKLQVISNKNNAVNEEMTKKNVAIEQGVQALLRDNLIQTYNCYYVGHQFMPIYAKESFMAVYMAYHDLGANGVMDDIFEKTMGLPTDREKPVLSNR